MEPIDSVQMAGGYGPPGGGYPPPGGAPPGGYGPPGGAPPGGYGGGPPGGYGPPGGPPPGGFGPPGGGYGGPPPGGFGPPGGPPGFGPPGMGMPPMGGDVNTTLPLVLNIIGICIGCCTYGIGSIFAIIGLIMTILAMNTKATNPEDARGKAKLGTIFGIISLVIGPILFIVFMAFGMFASVMENT